MGGRNRCDATEDDKGKEDGQDSSACHGESPFVAVSVAADQVMRFSFPPEERRCSGNKYSIGRWRTRLIVGPCRPGFRSSASRTSSAARACPLDGPVIGKRETAGEASQPISTFNAQRPSIRECLKAALSLLRAGPVSLPNVRRTESKCASGARCETTIVKTRSACAARAAAATVSAHDCLRSRRCRRRRGRSIDEPRRAQGPERSNGQLVTQVRRMIRSIRGSPS